MQQPYIRLWRDRKLQIFLGDRVPVLVHHHDAQKITYCSEKQTVKVMCYALADFGGEGVESDLSYYHEKDAKGDVAERPSVFEGVEDKSDL